MYKIRVKL